jgi:hypothetical protein
VLIATYKNIWLFSVRYNPTFMMPFSLPIKTLLALFILKLRCF